MAPPLLRRCLLPFLLLLFSFLTNETFHVSAWYPFTDRNSWTSPVQSVHGQYDWYFFRNEIRRVICIGALAGTVRYEIDFLDLDHLLTLNMVAPRCVYLPFPYYFLPFTIARTPLMQLSFYKYKCLWGGVRGGSSLQERVLHTHTHTHTHIYIYIYIYLN